VTGPAATRDLPLAPPERAGASRHGAARALDGLVLRVAVLAAGLAVAAAAVHWLGYEAGEVFRFGRDGGAWAGLLALALSGLAFAELLLAATGPGSDDP
jgi:hypothetical protein